MSEDKGAGGPGTNHPKSTDKQPADSGHVENASPGGKAPQTPTDGRIEPNAPQK